MSESDKTLDLLYPQLRSGLKRQNLDDTLAFSITEKANASIDTKRQFIADNTTALIAMAKTLAGVFAAGGKLLCMGNGGSSCDADHLAVEFNHPITTGRPALPAINLSADTAMMTAVGNDLGFEQVFVRPLISLGRPGDILFGISSSGNSGNMIAAFKAARDKNIKTCALLGGDGGGIARASDVDHCIVVGSTSVHRIQECHVLAYHIIWDLVHTLLADTRQ